MEQGDFEGYSYRVSGRFGSRVYIAISKDVVSVTGPRVGITTYRIWLAAQLILLFMSIVLLLTALIQLSWKTFSMMLVVTLAYWMVGTFGAVGFWELENLKTFAEGKKGQTVTFPRKAVKEVKIGRGWARKGLWLVVLPYMPGLNKVAENVCVSFIAPDGVAEGDSVYAFHMRDPEEARKLAGVLQA